MTAQLIINGEEADFFAVMEQMIQKAVTTALNAIEQPEFVPQPDVMYKTSDIRIQRMFGVETYKHPTQAINEILRRNGISPFSVRKGGSMITGRQITEYMAALAAKQTDYLKAN
jgi:hypothetical protein